jgi:23S rRNA pseudouridine1911/1915/1917 synthase
VPTGLLPRNLRLVTRLRVSEGDCPRPSDVAEGSIVSAFRVPAEAAGMRLDVFVQSQLKRTSRTRTQWIIKMSAYDDRGQRMKVNDRVRTDQEVFLWRAPWDETPVPTEIGVVYEDEHLLAVDKPANLPVHPTARYHKNTLIMLLKAERPGEFLTLGHRIDRETSGVLLVAKTPACERALKRQLEMKSLDASEDPLGPRRASARGKPREVVDKEYWAITWGVPLGPNGEQHFRHEQSVELDDESRYKVKMRVGKTATALYAATRFHVVDTLTANGRTYAKVTCDLETGRQHQIRVHLASVGAPIVGDKLYGPDESAFARAADGELTAEDSVMLELERHALHAGKMSLLHPVTREPLVIEAPYPTDMKSFWDGLLAARED